jgi:hypothetical protein
MTQELTSLTSPEASAKKIPGIDITNKIYTRILTVIDALGWATANQIADITGEELILIQQDCIKLERNKYIIICPIEHKLPKSRGRNPHVYALRPKGSDLLGVPHKHVYDVKDEFRVDHDVMVGDFFAAFFRDSERDNGIYLKQWTREPEMHKVVVPEFKVGNQTNHPGCVRADAFARVISNNKHFDFYPEAENKGVKKRKKFKQSSYLKKVHYYQALWRAGFKFQVPTMVKTEKHREGLRDVCQEADPAGIGLNIFCFALQKEISDPTISVTREAMWQTPSGEFRSLIKQ